MRFGLVWLRTTLASALLCAGCLGSPQPEPPTGTPQDASIQFDAGGGAGADAGSAADAGPAPIMDAGGPGMDAAVDGAVPDGAVMDGAPADGAPLDGEVLDGAPADGDTADADLSDAATDASDDAG